MTISAHDAEDGFPGQCAAGRGGGEAFLEGVEGLVPISP
jgi:hypothetical protein